MVWHPCRTVGIPGHMRCPSDKLVMHQAERSALQARVTQQPRLLEAGLRAAVLGPQACTDAHATGLQDRVGAWQQRRPPLMPTVRPPQPQTAGAQRACFGPCPVS